MKLLLTTAAVCAMGSASRPKALVYRGPAACDGCPESVAHLLRTSPSQYEVKYAGPKEEVAITAERLAEVDVFAVPGGPGGTWSKYLKPYKNIVRDFVADGGRYMGFCLGAYFAGRPGFNFLPSHGQTNEECTQPGAQVKNRTNTMIQVDWTYQEGPKAGQTEKQWMFFQDGAVILLHDDDNVGDGGAILGRYSSNGDVAATITPFGKGWVAITGPHVEATKDWCKFP